MFWVTKFAKLGGSLKGAIKEFTKMNGRMPSSGEMNKMEAIIKNTQSNVIPFPYKRSFKDEINQMSKKGDVTLSTTPKATPKDPIDQRWASQEEWKAKMKAQNKAALKRFEEKYGKPEDRASGGLAGQLHLNQGGRARFKEGLEVSPEFGFSKRISSPDAGIDIDETDRTYGISGSYQGPDWYTGGSFLKGKVKVDVTQDGDTIFKDTISKENAKNLYFGLGQKYGDKVELGTDTKGNWRINIKKSFKDGGRIGFDNGGMSRRGFLKLMGGLASIPILGKYFKLAKPAAKVMTAVEKSNAAGMPAWFPSLVNKVLKEGEDIGGTVERQVVKQIELPGSKTKVIVEQDLNTGNTIVDIGVGKHGWADGRHGQPTRLTLKKGEWIEPTKGKKGTKTKDEFDVEEAEFTGDAENIKYEDSVVEKYGEHGSDFTEVEKYATGKNVDKYNLKGTKKREADEFALGRAEMEANDFAKGGLAGVLKL